MRIKRRMKMRIKNRLPRHNYEGIITYPSYGIEDEVLATNIVHSNTEINLDEFIKTILNNLDISISQAYSAHMLEIDHTVDSIIDMFKDIDNSTVGTMEDTIDGWKWSNDTNRISPTSINSILSNTNLILDKFISICDSIYQSFGGYYRDTKDISLSRVANLLDPLKQVKGFNVIGGFKLDEKGKLNIAPKNDVKALPISKADVDNFNKIYKEIKHKLDRFYIIYNKCKKKFINIKDKAEKLTNTNTSFVLTTFSDIVGSFVLIKRLSSLDYGKMIMAVKKSF